MCIRDRFRLAQPYFKRNDFFFCNMLIAFDFFALEGNALGRVGIGFESFLREIREIIYLLQVLRVLLIGGLDVEQTLSQSNGLLVRGVYLDDYYENRIQIFIFHHQVYPRHLL
eukprot:TRINITY_DN14340_c0_g1_i1.p1 TRINITY_DN14340_c0_g1~~TRINITY_DN14340_c0_g1_i1.p1  ORF type:complete len:113 (+),score=3.68 TRINITY_DN14340_c0_g1_i1:80-418(+)